MQAVDTLIRRRILWRLVWICTVTLCSTNRKIGIYGLYNGFIALVKYIVDTDYKPADLDLCLLPFPQNNMSKHVIYMALHVMPGTRSIGTSIYRV